MTDTVTLPPEYAEAAPGPAQEKRIRSGTTAQALRKVLEECMPLPRSDRERPYAVAQMMLNEVGTSGAACHQLEATLNAYYALVGEPLIQTCLDVHAALSAKQHSREATALQFGCDCKAWSIADADRVEEGATKIRTHFNACNNREPSEQPVTAQVKAFAVAAQSRNFLFVLNQRFGTWSLHIREFWESLAEARASGRFLGAMEAFKDRLDLTLEDVLAIASAAESYSNETTALSRPTRPSLQTLLGGNLLAGSAEAGPGLHVGDARDAGYILSVKGGNRWDAPVTRDGRFCDYLSIGYATQLLNSTALACENPDS